jgi:predicted lactoylglutathione lyase
MTKDIWINLGVQDVPKSCAFYSAIGFPFNDKFQQTDKSASLFVANKLIVMLFEDTTFQGFTKAPADFSSEKSKVLISIDAESADEVDQLAEKVVAAGGALFGKSTNREGWMYGCGFIDPDGHRWNVVYMNWEKMPTP